MIAVVVTGALSLVGSAAGYGVGYLLMKKWFD